MLCLMLNEMGPIKPMKKWVVEKLDDPNQST